MQELGEFATVQEVEIDTDTCDIVFRIVKNCPENVTDDWRLMTLEETGDVVYHAGDFRFGYEIVKKIEYPDENRQQLWRRVIFENPTN